MDRRKDDGIDFQELINVVRKKKWFVLIPVLLSMVLVFLYFTIITRAKYVEFNVDTNDILIIKNGTIVKKFSMRDFKNLENIKNFSISEPLNMNRSTKLLEDRLIDSFTVRRELQPGMNPEGTVRDFFYRLDEVYFRKFKKDLEIKIMNSKAKLFRKKLNLKELNLKIDMIENFSRNKGRLYITSESMSSAFLPPGQQLNGYKISSGLLEIEIESLTSRTKLGSELLLKLEKSSTNSFREMLNLPDISFYMEQYVDQAYITSRISIIESKYLNTYKIKDNADLCIVFIVLIPLTVLVFQLFLVFFVLSLKSSGNRK